MTAFNRSLEDGKAHGAGVWQKMRKDQAARRRGVLRRARAGETVAEISAAMGYSEQLVTEDLQDMGLTDG